MGNINLKLKESSSFGALFLLFNLMNCKAWRQKKCGILIALGKYYLYLLCLGVAVVLF